MSYTATQKQGAAAWPVTERAGLQKVNIS